MEPNDTPTDDLERLVSTVLADVDFLQNPYFRELENGAFAFEDFYETQLQFYSAVTFFSRPMAALAAKIPNANLRVEIVRNVWEEHGEGESARMHESTFITFLSRLASIDNAAVSANLSRRILWPEVRLFNTLLSGVCVLDDYLVGAATMGIIERMFAEISSFLGRTIVARGFLSREAMIHYNLHEKLDEKHAADFFKVLKPAWAESDDARYRIEQGLRMGSVAFDQLYARLYRRRTRRWLR